MDYKFPIGSWGEWLVNFLKTEFRTFLHGLSDFIQGLLTLLSDSILFLPPYLFIVLISILAWRIAGWKIGLLSVIGLGFIWNMGLWAPMAETITLVLVAATITLSIGFPLGIFSARNDKVRDMLRPVLDVMQTLPSFVYLVPVVMFFGLGKTGGLVATMIFSMPPIIRFTDIGIRQVQKDVIEAAQAYGANAWQMLYEVQIPMARQTIVGGVNQTVMLNLSMTVIGGMIGAKGLGLEVIRSVQRVDISTGIESGLSVVFIAIIIDRILQALAQGST